MRKIAFIPTPAYYIYYIYSNSEASLYLSWVKRPDGRTEVRAEGCEFAKNKRIELITQIDSILKRAEKIDENEERGMTFLPSELLAG